MTLLTDFGCADNYVGVMKGVILSRAPAVRLVDLTHNVPPQDVMAGAFQLYTAVPYFPRETVHLAVVDPGVGSARRALAARTSAGLFVAPDNGLLTPLLSGDLRAQVVVLDREELWFDTVSHTFHGRDVFAPVAAALAGGADIMDVGSSVDDWIRMPWPEAADVGRGDMIGQVLHIDRFGDAVTNIPADRWGGSPVLPTVRVGGIAIPFTLRGYADVAVGEALAHQGSSGFIEIAVRNGNAAAELGLAQGDPVRVCGVREQTTDGEEQH